ncbi:HNH endonuclease family protein [Sorangium sp. So ce281]|uniref:HNH endonuclease family protein n=1 Tax=unclassified Sorangium TaxID=2621164 RepID=UPI003F644107
MSFVVESNDGTRHILVEHEDVARLGAGSAPMLLAELRGLRAAGITIDYVLPEERTFALKGRGFADRDEYEEQIHRLGNLTVVEERINSAAQKKTPEQKASADDVYKDSKFVAIRQIGVASQTNNKFGRDEVEARTQEPVDFCLKRWPP